MSSAGFTDCTWYKNGSRAELKARYLSFTTANSIFILRDNKTLMYGIGIGDGRPSWADKEEYTFVKVVQPPIH